MRVQVHEDLDNEGVLMHAVDTLPAELPIEATTVRTSVRCNLRASGTTRGIP